MDQDHSQQRQNPPRIELAYPAQAVTTVSRSPSPTLGLAHISHPETIVVNPAVTATATATTTNTSAMPARSTGHNSSDVSEKTEKENYDGETLSNSGHPLPPVPQREMSRSPGPGGMLHPPHRPPTRRQLSGDNRASTLGPRSGIDWIVPLDDKPAREKTTGERLEPTLAHAIAEKDKYALKARVTGYALNIAIGLQVLLGALTTGLSVVTTGRQTSIMTAILGGLSTIVASYLARARGSNEPELSITRVKDLEQFIRECRAFQMDHGHQLGDKFDDDIRGLRHRFEELLGNANG
ncbi:hypothetical protein NLJ89_g1023 [Agrocybe chaxingu]|uniref:SMODS and SLOG-associating 2TM effector domain-containing protein n=1 Tax=Agrocybe chaxingu TaxID=84603 RepID=A0A9W8TDZ8_9AGAR|nr:hypothetical protein NLJ89_g1023 [Agrocybe chaxingu]